MKFTFEQKKAIKRICTDYDFESAKEIKHYLRDEYGDDFCPEWFSGKTEQECYNELKQVIEKNF